MTASERTVAERRVVAKCGCGGAVIEEATARGRRRFCAGCGKEFRVTEIVGLSRLTPAGPGAPPATTENGATPRPDYCAPLLARLRENLAFLREVEDRREETERLRVALTALGVADLPALPDWLTGERPERARPKRAPKPACERCGRQFTNEKQYRREAGAAVCRDVATCATLAHLRAQPASEGV